MINLKQLRRLREAAVKDDPRADQFHDEFAQALRAGEVKLDDIRIRELFEEFVPDGAEAVQSWNPRHGGGNEPISMRLLEESGAVTSGGFSRISGQLVYSAILDKYAEETAVFSPLVKTIPTQFNGEKIAGISGIGDEAEVVAEGRPYPTAGVSEDYIETPATTKRGLIVGLTREAVFFDRTNVLAMRCAEVGGVLGVNKEKRIIDCVIDENRTDHRYKWKGTTYATYQTSTPWINSKTSNALVDWTNVDAVELLFNQMVDPYTGEPITITPKHMIVTRSRLNAAKRVLTATEIRSGDITAGSGTQAIWKNPINGYSIVWSAQLAARLGTDTSWFIGDITKAFAYMENWPMTVVQAPSNSEVEFTSDVVMRWKASERGAAATLDPRWMAKSAE